ncbi:MAG TPA: NAD(+) synthase, partial [Erysipelothrix sp.]
MNIIVAQTRIYGQNIKKNFENMKSIIESQDKKSLIVFPDLALTGSSGFLISRQSDQIKYLEKCHQALIAMSEDKAIVWGSIDNGMKAIFVAYNGMVQKIIKQKLSKDLYFQEALNYDSYLQEDNIVTLNGTDYSFSFSGDLKRKEGTVNIVLANSFWIKGIEQKRLVEVESYENPVVYVNAVGTQNLSKSVFVYDGGSFYKTPNKISLITEPFEEEVRAVDYFQLTYQTDLNFSLILKALVTLIKQFDEEVFSFRPNWIIGLSGGLDSSVSFALLNMALGNERVIPVTMPSKYNRSISKNNAQHLAEVFNIELLTIPVEELALETVETIKHENMDVSQGLAYENIQARLRGHILMSISSIRNGIVINNGNKIESALGYATMYGDAIGALSPLADLSKVEVGLLAAEINRQYEREMIPKNLIPVLKEDRVEWDFAPSAELAQDQFDPMKWGYHDILIEMLMRYPAIEILESYEDGSIYQLPIGRYLDVYGLNNAENFISDFEWV